jgi:ankyrin repeat protein
VNYIKWHRSDLTTLRFRLDIGANVNAEALFDVPIGNPKKPDIIQVHATVLGYAVFVHSTHVVELLLEYGANSNTKLKRFGGLSCWDLEFSPLGLAIRNGDLEVVTFLLSAGANTAATLFAGDTHSALFLACHFRNLPIVQCLLEHGQGRVDVNVIFPSRNSSSPVMLSPLCMACQNNNLEMAQLLVAHGAKVVYDGVFPNSPSPLKHAVLVGSFDLVRLLLGNSPFWSNNSTLHTNADFEGSHPLSDPLETALGTNQATGNGTAVDRSWCRRERPSLRVGLCRT